MNTRFQDMSIWKESIYRTEALNKIIKTLNNK